MERREGWLGYAAVGLGIVALLVALLSSGSPSVAITIPPAVVAPALPQELPVPAPTVVPPAIEPALPPGMAEHLEQELRRHREHLREVLPPDIDERLWQDPRRNELREEEHSPRQLAPAIQGEIQRAIVPAHHPWTPQGDVEQVVESAIKAALALVAVGLAARLLRGGRGGSQTSGVGGHGPA
jgi:hypothetical protein